MTEMDFEPTEEIEESADATATTKGDSQLEALLETIKEKVADFTSLDIVTVVGQVKPGQSVDDLKFEFTENTKTILTKINILDGDILTVIDEAYVTGEYKELRDFHAQREEKGYTIVRNNIAAFRELFSAAKSFIGE